MCVGVGGEESSWRGDVCVCRSVFSRPKLNVFHQFVTACQRAGSFDSWVLVCLCGYVCVHTPTVLCWTVFLTRQLLFYYIGIINTSYCMLYIHIIHIHDAINTQS